MRLLIVAPKYTTAPGDFYQFPLGLGYISSALKAAGHEVHCLNCNHAVEDEDVLVDRYVRAINPDVVATGGLSPYLPRIRKVFSAARLAKPSIINIAGGGVLSSDPEAGPLVMDIDAGVIGEGEETVVDLVDAFERGRDLAGVPGIVYRNRDGRIVRTATRDPILDLGAVPWPDYDGFGFGEIIDLQRPNDNYFFHTRNRPRSIDMITSRSCPYRCTFCFHPSGKVYRERPLDDFFAELDHQVSRYDLNMVAVIDELFSLKKSRLLEFCERIKPYGLHWMVQLHVNVADDHILQAMRDAGCTYISYGVESMSPTILESMKKKSKTTRIDKVLASTYEKKIGIQGNLIFGDPQETLETANESMHWWSQNRPYMIYTSRLEVHAGSPDFIDAVRDGLITQRVDYIDSQFVYPNISGMNDEAIEALTAKITLAKVALLNIVRPTIFEKEAESDPVRGDLHHIAWDCPRCGDHNDYRGLVLNTHEFRNHLRLTCRSCLTRFDIPNDFRIKFEERYILAEQNAGLEEAKALRAAGRDEEAVALLKKIIGRGNWYWPAHVELGHCYAAAGQNLSALRHYAVAVQHNPLHPKAHIAFADWQVKEKAVGMALLHYRQALQLDPDDAEAARKLRETEEGGWSEEERRTYFISYSDASAPQRLSPLPGVKPVHRKHEQDFPDIAKLEEEASRRIAAE
jgi:anaerobic magnesium-protoporphyrin IX monomethyl ester cyclase